MGFLVLGIIIAGITAISTLINTGSIFLAFLSYVLVGSIVLFAGLLRAAFATDTGTALGASWTQPPNVMRQERSVSPAH